MTGASSPVAAGPPAAAGRAAPASAAAPPGLGGPQFPVGTYSSIACGGMFVMKGEGAHVVLAVDLQSVPRTSFAFGAIDKANLENVPTFLAALQNSFSNIPEITEDRLRNYLPQTPAFTPSVYPNVPLAAAETPGFYERLTDDVLLFAFYYQRGALVREHVQWDYVLICCGCSWVIPAAAGGQAASRSLVEIPRAVQDVAAARE